MNLEEISDNISIYRYLEFLRYDDYEKNYNEFKMTINMLKKSGGDFVE